MSSDTVRSSCCLEISISLILTKSEPLENKKQSLTPGSLAVTWKGSTTRCGVRAALDIFALFDLTKSEPLENKKQSLTPGSPLTKERAAGKQKTKFDPGVPGVPELLTRSDPDCLSSLTPGPLQSEPPGNKKQCLTPGPLMFDPGPLQGEPPGNKKQCLTPGPLETKTKFDPGSSKFDPGSSQSLTPGPHGPLLSSLPIPMRTGFHHLLKSTAHLPRRTRIAAFHTTPGPPSLENCDPQPSNCQDQPGIPQTLMVIL